MEMRVCGVAAHACGATQRRRACAPAPASPVSAARRACSRTRARRSCHGSHRPQTTLRIAADARARAHPRSFSPFLAPPLPPFVSVCVALVGHSDGGRVRGPPSRSRGAAHTRQPRQAVQRARAALRGAARGLHARDALPHARGRRGPHGVRRVRRPPRGAARGEAAQGRGQVRSCARSKAGHWLARVDPSVPTPLVCSCCVTVAALPPPALTCLRLIPPSRPVRARSPIPRTPSSSPRARTHES